MRVPVSFPSFLGVPRGERAFQSQKRRELGAEEGTFLARVRHCWFAAASAPGGGAERGSDTAGAGGEGQEAGGTRTAYTWHLPPTL